MSLLASAAAEPSAVFWRVLGGTKAEANEVAAPARSCSRAVGLPKSVARPRLDRRVRREAPPREITIARGRPSNELRR